MIDLEQMKKSGALLNDRYELKETIGKGGFSGVWKVFDTKSKKDFAIKVYAGVDKEGEDLFLKEFALVSSLNHTNVISLDFFDVYKGTPYIVMPYCEKGSVVNMVERMSEQQIWDFISQVAAGLAYIHSKDIIHRDIKPGNILVFGEDQYIITDFGISTSLRNSMRRSVRTQHPKRNSERGEERSNKKSEGLSSDFAGTIAYMAYETLQAKPLDVTARDIWALGASIYEIMTGDVPFGELGGIAQHSMNGKIPKIKNKKYSRGLKKLVYMCLDAKTYKRPSAEEIVEICSRHNSGKRLFNIEWKRPLALCISAAAIATLVIFGGQRGYDWYKSYLQNKIQAINDSTVSSVVHPNEPNAAEIVLLAEINDATNNVANEGKKRNADKRNIQTLVNAAKTYHRIINTDISDSIKNTCMTLWQPSQKIIDDTYRALSNMAIAYHREEADGAAQIMNNKCRQLVSFISKTNANGDYASNKNTSTKEYP